MHHKEHTTNISSERDTRNSFITVLRFVACLLIINSHCREIYPLYYFAVGGGHGNAIFFVLSGYCLANIHHTFLTWYNRRVKRIMPVTCVVLLLGIILDGFGHYAEMSILDILLLFLDRYWFVWAILIYYILFYGVFFKKSKRIVQGILLAFWLGYIVLYIFFLDKTVFSVEQEGFSPFKVYFYFGVFLLGGLIRMWKDTSWDGKCTRKRILINVAIILLSGIVWCTEYFLVMVLNTGVVLQFLIHLSVFTFAAAVLLLGIYIDDLLRFPQGACYTLVKKISESTLEIYLVQVTVQHHLPNAVFPLNWVAFVGSALVGGIFVRDTFLFFERRLRRSAVK